jgi:hypothetical protein
LIDLPKEQADMRKKLHRPDGFDEIAVGAGLKSYLLVARG